jgi:RimJ/RimL family protein N-acetyltransferase
MIEIKILGIGDEPALESFLFPRVDSSMFLIGNMRVAGLVDKGGIYQGTYAAAFENGKMVGVVAHFWNENVLSQSPIQHLNALWRAAVTESGRPVRGIIGPDDQVEHIKQAMALRYGQIRLDETEDLYGLSLSQLILPRALREGTVHGRRIEEKDLDLATQWRIDYSLEALGERDSQMLRHQCRITMEQSMQEGRTWILEADGRPVSSSSFNAVITEAVQIGGVWTPPQLRSRGYARSAVAASLVDAIKEKIDKAILFTGVKNIPAQKAYLSLGFEQVGDYRIVLLHEPLVVSQW